MYKLERRHLKFTFGETVNGEREVYLNGKLTDYTISTKGEFISYKTSRGGRGKVLSPYPVDGRLRGNLIVDKRYSFDLDRLMVEAFFFNDEETKKIKYDLGSINYRDGDFTNLDIENIVFKSADGTQIYYEGGEKKIEKSHSV